VLGLGYTKVYFQIGMVVGDIEEHNKICGFHGDNGLYRQHVCRDCSVCTEDADNPDIECELREVADAYKFLKQYLDKETYPALGLFQVYGIWPSRDGLHAMRIYMERQSRNN
jgi:hypothetical protein